MLLWSLLKAFCVAKAYSVFSVKKRDSHSKHYKGNSTKKKNYELYYYLNLTWSICVHLGLSWFIWIYYDLSRAILSYLDPFWTKIEYLELSQAISGSHGLPVGPQNRWFFSYKGLLDSQKILWRLTGCVKNPRLYKNLTIASRRLPKKKIMY